MTGFIFQHHFKFTQPKEGKSTSWEANFSQSFDDQDMLKQAIRDSLGLFGHLPWWMQHTDSLDYFHFTIIRPAKKYEITVLPETEQVKVVETKTGVWSALFGAHSSAAGGPKTPMVTVWKYLSQVLAFLSLFTILSSLYIWRPRNQKRLYNWIIFVSAIASSLLLILFVWLIG